MSTENRISKRIQIILGIIIVVLLSAILGIVSYRRNHISTNPAGTIGNTAGNLNNGGLFCEYNGVVYFSNATTNGCLYAMSPDESNLRKLNGMNVRNILAGGEYLYYFQLGSADDSNLGSVTNTHAFNRCDLNGKNAVGISRDVIVSGQLVDNYLYLLASGKENPEFYKLKIDKSEKVSLADYSINPACAFDSSIYYNGTLDNHYLYRLNTTNDVASLVLNENLWYPVYDNGYIYYMDLSSNYRLCRYSLTAQTIEILTHDRVDCFNVGSGYIYYQTNDRQTPQLKCMHTDGSNVFVLADGVYNHINMTSQYVYFQTFQEAGSLYHSRLGSDQYSGF